MSYLSSLCSKLLTCKAGLTILALAWKGGGQTKGVNSVQPGVVRGQEELPESGLEPQASRILSPRLRRAAAGGLLEPGSRRGFRSDRDEAHPQGDAGGGTSEVTVTGHKPASCPYLPRTCVHTTFSSTGRGQGGDPRLQTPICRAPRPLSAVPGLLVGLFAPLAGHFQREKWGLRRAGRTDKHRLTFVGSEDHSQPWALRERTLSPCLQRLLPPQLSPRVSFPISAALQWNPQRERAQRQVMGLERA